MLNENAKKWVAALRSGKYQQTKNKLTKVTAGGEVVGHCCLGVACVLAKENGVDVSVFQTPYGFLEYEGDGDVLPWKVQKWLGLDQPAGAYGKTDVKGDRPMLSLQNDNGASFSEIADIIESEPEGLFV